MLIKLKSGEIPPKLTPNMKELIQKIDGSSQKEQPEERVKQSSSQMRTSNFFDETQFNNQSQNVVEEKKETKVKNKSSAEFDNFADFGAFGSKKEKSQPPAPPAPERNLRISTSSFENTSNAISRPSFQCFTMTMTQMRRSRLLLQFNPSSHPLRRFRSSSKNQRDQYRDSNRITYLRRGLPRAKPHRKLRTQMTTVIKTQMTAVVRTQMTAVVRTTKTSR